MSKKHKIRDEDVAGKISLIESSGERSAMEIADEKLRELRDQAVNAMSAAMRVLPVEEQIHLLVQTRFLAISTPGTDGLRILDALLRDAAELTGIVGTDFEREDDWQPAMRLTSCRRYLLRALCAVKRAEQSREANR